MLYTLKNIKDINDSDKILIFQSPLNNQNFILYRNAGKFIVQSFNTCGEYYGGEDFSNLKDAKEYFLVFVKRSLIDIT